MSDYSKIVAVGLLTQRDLDNLGSGFKNTFPIIVNKDFDDLLRAIDDAIRSSSKKSSRTSED